MCASLFPGDEPKEELCGILHTKEIDGVALGINWQLEPSPYPDDFYYGVVISQPGEPDQLLKTKFALTASTPALIVPLCYSFTPAGGSKL